MSMGFPPRPPFRSQIPHWTERVVTYCAKVLPIVFDNSLSYYEFLGHIQVKLNEVIKALNSQNLVFVEFTHMIELELQNFESYMEERQTNFEEQMQEEWQEFKTEMETAWNEFKTAMEQAWQEYKDEMDQAWADFQADMQEAFENFQTLITTQQQQFETLITNQQNQFQADMTSRQNNFESTLEDEFEQWKVDTLDALQQGIQQFEQDAMEALRAALPGMIEETIPDVIAPAIASEVGNQDFARITDISNTTAGAALNLSNYDIALFQDDVLVDDTLTLADLSNIEIKPNTTIMIKSDANEVGEFCRVAGSTRVLSGDSSFPASGYTISIGYYTTDNNVLTVFEPDNYQQITQAAIEDVTRFVNTNLNTTFWENAYRSNHYFTIRFLADDGTAAFYADYSQGIEAFSPVTADVILQDERTGQKVSIPKPSAGSTVDQTYDPTSANAQSGTAVAEGLATRTTPAEIMTQRFGKMLTQENQTFNGYHDLTNELISIYNSNARVQTGVYLHDLTALTITHDTTIVFTDPQLIDAVWRLGYKISKSDFPASGYTVSVGIYRTDNLSNTFDPTKYTEIAHNPITQSAGGSSADVAVGSMLWIDGVQTYIAIRFSADASAPDFTCDYSSCVDMQKPYTADIVLQNQATGQKYTVKRAPAVEQTYDSTSANAQSGVAVAQAVAAVPTVTVDQTVNYQSTNPASSMAISDYGIIKNTSENSTSITQGSSTGISSTSINMFFDYPVGTLFLVTITNGTYCGSAIIPLSGTDTATSTTYYSPAAIVLSPISAHSVASSRYNIGLEKGTDTNITIYYALLPNTTGLTGNWNIRVQKLSLTSRSNTL